VPVALERLTLFDYGAIAVTVIIPITFADRHASPHPTRTVFPDECQLAAGLTKAIERIDDAYVKPGDRRALEESFRCIGVERPGG
jgi:hypothetical protein